MGSPAETITELCRHFYGLGWVSGTGGGIGIRDADGVHVAPSGVQKERIEPRDIFRLDMQGGVVEAPQDATLRPSECVPLFLNAFRLRDAGAVIHSHAPEAVLATLGTGDVFECTRLEMIKGIAGHGYEELLQVPIIDNTARERDLAGRMAEAMEAYPRAHAVLVRRHGVYVWGRDWVEAKTHAECYHYLFDIAVRMRQQGVDPAGRNRP